MKLEIGAGHRPTRGYDIHNDIHPGPHIEDVGPAWMIDLPDQSVDEVLALAFVEHLTYYEAVDTFRNVHRMLRPGGLFLFDVPDYPKWCQAYLNALNPDLVGGDIDACRRTLFGWARFPGDEHKYGWDMKHLYDTLRSVGFDKWGKDNWDVTHFQQRVHRDRFNSPTNAHLYVTVAK